MKLLPVCELLAAPVDKPVDVADDVLKSVVAWPIRFCKVSIEMLI
jgi:hypothetical protein